MATTPNELPDQHRTEPTDRALAPPSGIFGIFKGGRLAHWWEYRTCDGLVLGIVARYDHSDGRKDCIPYFKRDGHDWAAGGPPSPKTLFGLHTIVGATECFVCEGERATAALHHLGLAAVCSIGGAANAGHADWSPLASVGKVTILPDHDQPGERYAQEVFRILARFEVPPTVVIARLPGLSDGEDVVDFLQQRVRGWDGFTRIPRESGDGLFEEVLEAIAACATDVPPEWTAVAGVVHGDAWEAPLPLVEVVPPEWPNEVLPGPANDFVRALAAFTETPIELPSMMAFAVMATAVQGKYRVQVKPGYFEPLALWVCVVLQSGSRKTSVLEAVKAPLVEWERRERDRMEPIIRAAKADRKTMEMRIESLRRKAASCRTRNEQVNDLLQQIQALEYELPEVPRAPQLWTTDTTSEGLAVSMAEQGGRMALLCDEGGPFDTMAGKYNGGMPNLDIYLQAHAGSDVRINRVSRPPVVIESPTLTIGISPQPGVLAGFTNTPEFRGRGLLARFLYAVPQSNLGVRTGDGQPIPEGVRAAFKQLVLNMVGHIAQTNEQGRTIPYDLALSPAAYDLWQEFWREVEQQMGPGGAYCHLTDWAGKLPGAVARIAAVLHVARHAEDRPWEYPISAADMDSAIRLVRALGFHARIAFACMHADPALEKARHLAEWMRRKGYTQFTKRQAQSENVSRFQKSSDLDAPLKLLVDRGYIRREESPAPGYKRGPRSETYTVNPAWLQDADIGPAGRGVQS